MAKRRTTRPKGPKKISEQEDHATSPPLDLASNPASDTSPTDKPRPKPRPKPAKNSTTLPVPDAMDHPQHETKRGRSKSNADETIPTSTDQPPAKKKKGSNGTLMSSLMFCARSHLFSHFSAFTLD